MKGRDLTNILENYASGQVWLGDIEVEIEGGENELDPLTLLRAYEEQEKLEVKISLAQQFCLNKRVVFTRNGKQVLAFVYTGGDFSKCFASAPYLLDILLRASLGLLLKKLTPPSEDSVNEERPSEKE